MAIHRRATDGRLAHCNDRRQIATAKAAARRAYLCCRSNPQLMLIQSGAKHCGRRGDERCGQDRGHVHKGRTGNANAVDMRVRSQHVSGL